MFSEMSYEKKQKIYLTTYEAKRLRWDLTEDLNILTSGANINVLMKISLSVHLLYIYLVPFSRYSQLFVESRRFYPTHLIWHPRKGWPRLNFMEIYNRRREREIFLNTLILSPLVRILKSSVKCQRNFIHMDECTFYITFTLHYARTLNLQIQFGAV